MAQKINQKNSAQPVLNPTQTKVSPTAISTASKQEHSSAFPLKKANEKKAVLEERIRKRAFELYAQRGFRIGNAERDWFDAEREIKNEDETGS